VLLSGGWDHAARKGLAKYFAKKWKEMEMRHSLLFELHEEGKLSFENYLDLWVFYEKYSFTPSEFRSFICEQSLPFPAMLGLVKQIKKQYGLMLVVMNNESREITYRIKEFKLDGFVDFFVSSCYVRLRKPDPEIFRLALDLAQASPKHVSYLDNTPMFIGIAEGLGISSTLYTGYGSTCTSLASLGLRHTR